jgi:hypothetical protein
MWFRQWAVRIVLLMSVLGVVSVGAQAVESYLIVDLPDFGSVTYPMDTYSLRPASDFSIPQERSVEVLFPGFMSITPNDSFLAEQRGAGKMVYSVHFAAVAAPEGTTADDLVGLLGQTPLVSYEASALASITPAVFTHNGLPAVRVNNVMSGSLEIVSHILILNGANLIEVFITPAKSYAAPAFNDFVTGEADGQNLALVEQIWASIQPLT